MLQPGCWPGGKAVAVVLEGLGFESWPEIVFFPVSKKFKNSEKNELLVFPLFAQVLSAKI